MATDRVVLMIKVDLDFADVRHENYQDRMVEIDRHEPRISASRS